MTVHAEKLPDNIEQGSEGGPGFKTSIIGVGSGFEQRNIEWSLERGEWDASYGVQSREDFIAISNFYRLRRGRGFGFLWKDWGDFWSGNLPTVPLTVETLGVGDGVNDLFQLVKNYSDSSTTYVRKITRPVAATVTVFVDAVEQTIVTDYTIDALGIINFVTPPAVAAVVTASFEFEIPVRFDTDRLILTLEQFDAGALPEIKIVELRE